MARAWPGWPLTTSSGAMARRGHLRRAFSPSGTTAWPSRSNGPGADGPRLEPASHTYGSPPTRGISC
eukprot:65808-Lingulodinium_polyedra.AAC.1